MIGGEQKLLYTISTKHVIQPRNPSPWLTETKYNQYIKLYLMY